MKIQTELKPPEASGAGRGSLRRARRLRVGKAGPSALVVKILLQDPLADWDLASERDLEFLADQAEAHEPGTMEPGNADDEVLREFHRAVTERGGRTLSGRML